jgi:hypothetical protein
VLLKKELQGLAQALKATPEYVGMADQRRKLMRDPALGRQMMSFEKEHTRLLNMDLREEEASSRLDKLYAEYKGFLEHQDVKIYIQAALGYQSMVAENIKFLNGLLEA